MTQTAAPSYWQLGLLLSLFVLWGACNSLNDVLIPLFRRTFQLSDMGSSLVQTAFYSGYLFGSMPAAWLARRRGYKCCVCTGLTLVCAGSALFWPSSRAGGWYPALLGCLYLLAFGLAFLECSANPWIVLLGERRATGSGTRALNLAQSFNPLGSVGGALLGRNLILSDEVLPEKHRHSFGETAGEHRNELLRGIREDTNATGVAVVGPTYLALAATFSVVGLAFALSRWPAGDGRGHTRQPLSCRVVGACWGRRRFARGVGAQFLCIGAQTCVWSFTIRYIGEALPEVRCPWSLCMSQRSAHRTASPGAA